MASMSTKMLTDLQENVKKSACASHADFMHKILCQQMYI